MSRKVAILWTRIAVVTAFIAALEILCREQIIKPLVMIPPSEMATALWDLIQSGKIKDDIVQTSTTVAVAFAISIVAGLALGALIHALPRVRRAVDPLLASYYSIPFFVFYPLLIALFGLNTIPLIVIGFVFATAAMVISTLNGLDRVPRVMVKTARILRLSPTKTLLMITLPSATPYLFTGLKLALAYSFIGVIAGEFILSAGGLGFSIAYAYNNFDSQTMYALMMLVLLIVTIVNGVLHVFEQRMLRRQGR
jgi:NitT/TauT family transport system permease protein